LKKPTLEKEKDREQILGRKKTIFVYLELEGEWGTGWRKGLGKIEATPGVSTKN